MMWVSSNRGARRRPSRAYSRRRGNPIFRHSLIGAAALAAGLSASAASADEIVEFEWWGPLPNLEVASDGDSYTDMEIPAPAFFLTPSVTIVGARSTNRIKEWSFSPLLDYEDPATRIFKPLIELDTIKYSETFEKPRPKDRLNHIVTLPPIPFGIFAKHAAGACNLLAENLRSKGVADEEIFKTDREIPLRWSAGIRVDFTWIPGEKLYNPAMAWGGNAKIICKATPPSRAPVVEVPSSALAITETSNFSACRLNTAGSITSLRPNQTVSFRYVDEEGKESDVKTVTTSASKIANFTHQLPLPDDGGALSGKIRMVGENLPFQSPWADYAVNCNVGAGVGGKTTELPPLINIDAAGSNDQYHRGYACPSLVRMAATLDGRQQTTGNIALVAGGQLVMLEPFSINEGKQQHFVADYHGLDWTGIQPDDGVPPQQTVAFTAKLVGDSSEEKIAAKTHQETFVCEPVYPKPDVSVSTVESVTVDGQSCPSKVAVAGKLKGRGEASGKAYLHVGGPPKHNEAYDIKGSESPVVLYIHDLKPSDYEKGEGGRLRSKLETKLVVYNTQFDLLERFEKDHTLECSLGPRVEVPMGEVRVLGDRVVLGGAKPNEVHLLKFSYRGNNSGNFKLVEELDLPTKTVTGVAKFNRREMEPGRWRVEVCATRGGKGTQALPGACSTANFVVQKRQMARLKVHVAGGTIRLQGAQPTATYLLMFHHKSKLGGKFRRTKASHLPTKAKGGVAKVNLGKLTPGQWRVEVCATQGGRMLPGSCIPGNFEVRRAANSTGLGEVMQQQDGGTSTIFPGGNPWQ